MSDLIFPGSKWVHDESTQTVVNTDTGQLYFVTKQTIPIDADINAINRSAQNGNDPFSGTVSTKDRASDKYESDLQQMFERPSGLSLRVTLPGDSRTCLLTEPR